MKQKEEPNITTKSQTSTKDFKKNTKRNRESLTTYSEGLEEVLGQSITLGRQKSRHSNSNIQR